MNNEMEKYEMPKSAVTYRKPRKLSDEVVARKREQMKNMKKNISILTLQLELL